VIVPYFAEALKPGYAEYIQFKKYFDIIDIAHSVDDFENLIIERPKNNEVSYKCMKESYDLFEKYVSSMKDEALESYL
jgi:hypothetical protein